MTIPPSATTYPRRLDDRGRGAHGLGDPDVALDEAHGGDGAVLQGFEAEAGLGAGGAAQLGTGTDET